MKILLPNSFKVASTLFGLAGMLLLSSPCEASLLDFQYSFVNNNGYNTTAGAVVTGRILGLTDNSQNWGGATVTFDSVSTGFDAGFAATSWTDFGQFTVSSGVLSYADFSHNDGTMGIDLHNGDRGLIYLSSFSSFYRNTPGDITFSSLSVPDAASTFELFAGALLALGACKSFLRRRA